MTVCRLAFLFLAATAIAAPAQNQTQAPPMPDILYGVAYYHEYMPYERLDKDIALMKQANVSVVRVGESTWSLWEAEDGKFEYAWMDRVVDAMSKAGIKVIMGTPTYSIPTWMARAHPEILAVGPDGRANTYGMRQTWTSAPPPFASTPSASSAI